MAKKEKNRDERFTKEKLVEQLDITELNDPRQLDFLLDYINNFFRPASLQKTLTEMAEECGYAGIPSKGVRARAAPILNKMATERLRALELMSGKAEEADYRDLTLAVDKLSRAMLKVKDMADDIDRRDHGVKLTSAQYERLIKLEAERRGYRPPEEGDYSEKSGEVIDRLLRGRGQDVRGELASQGDSGGSGEGTDESDQGEEDEGDA